MASLRETRTVGAVAWAAILSLASPSVLGREAKLAICPQKAPAEPGKWSLLPPQESLIEGDAAPLYDKAVEALPGKDGDEQIREWLDMPIDQLPVERVEQTLARHMESLRCAVRAARCRQCEWQHRKPGDAPLAPDGYRRLAFAIRLWARLEVARGGYEGAILALQTGFGMARHHGQGPTLVRVLSGIATGAAMCREVEEFSQRKGSPNLYRALASLPRPFMEVEKAIENERKAVSGDAASRLPDEQYESVLKPAHDRVRGLAKRFESDLAILQCVEAIRSYAASHDGQLPGALADVTEVPVPKDPIGGEPFKYTRTGSTAVLESALLAGGREADRTRYEIAVKD